MIKMAVLLILLSVGSFVKADESKKYTIAYNEATAPFVPLVRAIYKEMEIEADFVLVPSERALFYTNSGRYDADLSRAEGSILKYPNLIFSKEPVKKTRLYAFVKKNSLITLDKISDIKNYKVGIVLGSKLPEMFVAKENLSYETAKTVANFYSMLEFGRFDIGLVTDTQLLGQTKEMNSLAKRVGPILTEKYSFHVLNKRNEKLMQRFDTILHLMKFDGRYEKLIQTALK